METMKWRVYLAAAQLDEQTVGTELDVPLHEVSVHADEGTGECVGEEVLLDGHGFPDDAVDLGFTGLVVEVLEHQAGEVAVQALGKIMESAH